MFQYINNTRSEAKREYFKSETTNESDTKF